MISGLTGLAMGGMLAGAALQDPGAAAPVQYDMSFENARHHEAQVTVTYRQVPAGPLKLQMSRSSPGRYAMHEFAKNVYSLSAVDGAGHALKVERADPYSWTVPTHDGTVKVTYTLFGDHGDGTYAQIDATHAHLNMPAAFLWASGYDAKPIRIRFHRADPSWKIATQLPAAVGEPDTFWAPNLQYFMDSPTELADLTFREWQVKDGAATYTFRLALHDPSGELDADAYADKLKRLTPQHQALFGALPKFDFGTYTFIADYMPQTAFDGMEHRNSTFLTGPLSLHRSDFAPQLNAASHEFIHAWNVKRLRPVELEPFNFTRANPSPSLWLAEGFTNYYGPLMIRRAGQSSVDDYLRNLSGALNGVLNNPGRAYGAPRDMSLHAPFLDAAVSIDTINPNISISYYTEGNVLGLALDLELRSRFKGITLDDYMRRLWRTYGAPEKAYAEADLRKTLGELTGDAAFADAFFNDDVDAAGLPDFEPLLAQAGLTLRKRAPDRAWLGVRAVRTDGPDLLLDQPPFPGSPLYAAGLEKGDRILSIGRFPLASEGDWQDALNRLKPGEATTIRFVQRGRMQEAPITIAADPALEIVRGETAGHTPTTTQLAFREAWLGADLAKGEMGKK